ncbi:DNA polymerase III subunit delta [Gilliamella apicola]|uniref:DNA polymerase III subunit delta n=1 Tax=Gilliamella apicola TaxID=1196095 RepID=UPI00042E362C|nr:DNA polymerase III subunit delta [Gilliamella apicola]AHN25470.1 DNA polymerase III delta subunit [Gilliamella apicola]ORF46027.1 DNA polymerase III subunit delta [Gilliamella apicola]ORF49419.1 DNA polymerase III subunit delta [Gilliamella apicola]ORF52401.1 DNA polymerase III subunit delta [Gilliamella apicola]ORF53488.1 DNA polymerase III subunit delta [Gilliamella apicola]
MIKISADQITTKLGSPYYLIIGNDPYLQHYAQTQLKTSFKQLGFNEQLTFNIDNQTDWSTIFDSCQEMNLFSDNTLIFLDFGEGSINANITTKLNTLSEMLTAEIVLIISLNKITKANENAQWYKRLSDKLVVVSCNTPDEMQLPKWVTNHLQQKQMQIEPQAIELLCYYYEGNLLALTQIIEQLKLLFPNQTITYDQIENNINDSAIFTPYHWIDAMVSHKTKRATHIMQQLKMNEFEPLILLRVIQRELILLINLKKGLSTKSFKQIFDEYKIWQNKRSMYTTYLNRFDIKDLFNTLKQLTEIEISFKHDSQLQIWDALSALTLQFMGIK